MKQKPLTPRQVRAIRESLGMTQVELADALDKHRVTVSRWENGTCPVGLSESEHLRSIAAKHKGAAA